MSKELNEKIALFMNLHKSKYGSWCRIEDLTIVNGEQYAEKWITVLDYDSNWSSLMPVVEKIQTMENGRFFIHVDPWSMTVIDYSQSPEVDIIKTESHPGEDRLKERYFDIVTQFIEWYNKNVALNEND